MSVTPTPSPDDPLPPAPEGGAVAPGKSKGSRLFQISEDDLAELERIIPQFAQRLTSSPWYNEARDLRTQMRRVKSILSDVRWEGLPYDRVYRVE